MKRVVEVGAVFNRLIVEEMLPSANNHGFTARCRCSCGNQIVVQPSKLRSKQVQSCGCLGREIKARRKGYFEDLAKRRRGQSTIGVDRGWISGTQIDDFLD